MVCNQTGRDSHAIRTAMPRSAGYAAEPSPAFHTNELPNSKRVGGPRNRLLAAGRQTIDPDYWLRAVVCGPDLQRR